MSTNSTTWAHAAGGLIESGAGSCQGEPAYPKRCLPDDEAALLARARGMVGRTLGEIASQLGAKSPRDLRRAKGWVGGLVEAALGAPGGSRPGPDFPALGVELKTIPVDVRGRPRESTFVCALDLAHPLPPWERSPARAKLMRVLWVPIQSEPRRPADRHMGSPVLWVPSPAEERTLREDWELLSEMLEAGLVDRITARVGRALQMRPKAANGRALRWASVEPGETVRTLPRGIYLRAAFTAEVLARRLLVAAEPPPGAY